MTIKNLIEKGRIMLKTNGIDEPKIKARMLMGFMLNKPRQYLIVYDSQELSKDITEKYLENIKKIINGIPIQHITNKQEFMKMNFYVDENVLIPRPDTEILVEEIIKISKNIKNPKILDMCTGSGAIAVSLAKYIKNSNITAVDISSKAIQIAKKNAETNEVKNQITFIKSDLFTNLEKQKYDIIVSNPPYIKTNVIKTLDNEVQKEPIIALDGGEDGLKFYRKIINESYEYLKYQGYLCLEIGYDQKEDVLKLIEKQEKYINTYCKKDLCENDRIIVTKLN